ncbi:NAD(P)-dependent oxidoreductase [Nonomuraea candida]|uniref:NAD(P)-dependent oxidoreductase n=1 Tax=Nonomuraea candida TaxID=359159 RepID=UPI0005B9D167|nr:NAD(P)-binding domain-containing protein [Nonomuraea candida]
MARTPVTVIGLGLMGQALAGAFVRAGHPTTVWNRTPGKADALVGAGATEAPSVEAAVAAAPLVVVCVRDYDAVRALLAPAEAALSGRVLVNLTSGASDEARELAGWAAERGADYLDGAIMMTPPGIGAPETVILYGGPPSLYETHEQTLVTLGGASTLISHDVGLPAVYDVALLGIMWSTFNGFMHAAALMETEKISATAFLPMATGWLKGVASFLEVYARQIDDGSYTAVDASLETQIPPVRHLIHESRTRGIDTSLAELTERLITEAVGRGHALDSYARVIDHFRPSTR